MGGHDGIGVVVVAGLICKKRRGLIAINCQNNDVEIRETPTRSWTSEMRCRDGHVISEVINGRPLWSLGQSATAQVRLRAKRDPSTSPISNLIHPLASPQPSTTQDSRYLSPAARSSTRNQAFPRLSLYHNEPTCPATTPTPVPPPPGHRPRIWPI